MLQAQCLWHPGMSRKENVYVMFQTGFFTSRREQMEIRVLAGGFYRLYMDGVEIANGPSRYDREHPEYDAYRITVVEGSHLLTVVVHHFGVSTRMLPDDIPAFLQCELSGSAGIVTTDWRCKEITAYAHIGRRVNGQLGWAEWCDTRLLPDLTMPLADEEALIPMRVETGLGPYRPKSVRDCLAMPVEAVSIDEGIYVNRFGYDNDDPPVRFMLRDLTPSSSVSPEGVWFRFDLGAIGLYRPRIVLDVPVGTVVEAGYAEALTDGRVIPVITLSASDSCHMDRWIAKAGEQELLTFSPRGFRFLELHIAATPAQVKLVSVFGEQRTYYAEPEGMFRCSDPLLNDIWDASVKTLRACSEDALVDTPTRERGQWLGDAVAVGMETLGVAYGDLSLIRRSLLQAAYCRRKDGVVAGLYPGQGAYIGSYALLWVSGCMRYYRLTGDAAILGEVYETAKTMMDVFLSRMTPRGMVSLDVWDFIDWGHVVESGEVNVSLHLLLLGALRDLQAWETTIGIITEAPQCQRQILALETLIQQTFFTSDGLLAKSVPSDVQPTESVPRDGVSVKPAPTNDTDSDSVVSPGPEAGYHATVLGLWFGLFEGEGKRKAVRFIKQHMKDCFPNNVHAPRLAHPMANHAQLITPYFSHFALHALWEAGESEFVLEQYRTCWGWMLESGATTLLEVFDLRWSHCHAWSGCPAWQLSRHVLGLSPDESGDCCRFYWNPKPGRLEHAEGSIPLGDRKGGIRVRWEYRTNERDWVYELESDRPIRLALSSYWSIDMLKVDGTQTDGVVAEIEVGRSVTIHARRKV